jgi:hypothetical protein
MHQGALRVDRMENQGLETRLWVGNHSREIEIQGQSLILYRCPLCGRDFAREPGMAVEVSCCRYLQG